MSPQDQQNQGQPPNGVVTGGRDPSGYTGRLAKLRVVIWPPYASAVRRLATVCITILLLVGGALVTFALVSSRDDDVATVPQNGDEADRTFPDARQPSGEGHGTSPVPLPSPDTTDTAPSTGPGTPLSSEPGEDIGNGGSGSNGNDGNGGDEDGNGNGGGPEPDPWGLDFPDNPVYQLSSVSYYEAITYNFDGDYTAGQYANGDWWVVGPVTLTGITPDSTTVDHGENINPGVQQKNYRACIGTPVHQLEFPVEVEPDSSIVKTTSRFGGPDGDGCWKGTGGHRGNLQTAAVLTVVDAPPPKNGAIAFRPAYFGNDKAQYLTTDLRTDLLPNLEPPAGSFTSLANVANKFARVQLGHSRGTEESRWIAPVDNRRDYGGDYARDTHYAPIRLMMDDPLTDKSQALINYIQFGIDSSTIAVAESNVCQPRGNPSCAGHGPGRYLPLVFAATLLHSADDIRTIAADKSDQFQENWMPYYANAPAQVAIYGETNCSVEVYLAKLESASNPGSRTCKDPWGYIDGGGPFGSYLQCCIVSSWKSAVTAVHLMPVLQDNWPDSQRLIDFIDRWVDFGWWTQPDPESGQSPEREATVNSHGQSADGGDRRVEMVDGLWDMYDLSDKVTIDWADL